MNAATGWLRASGWITLGILVLGYVLLLQYLRTGLPRVPYFSNTALLPVGWPELSRSIERRKVILRDGGSVRVLIVGMDHGFLASEAAFYQTDQTRAVQETTGGHLFEGHSLMYAYWFPPREQDGATLLLVSFRRNELKTGTIHRRCETLGPIEEHTLQVNGRPVRAYYTRVAYSYHSVVYRHAK